MKILKFEDRESWEKARRGKATGSRIKKLVVKRGTDEKADFYDLIAERLAIRPDGEHPMVRGNRLEDEAISRLEDATGVAFNTDLVIWEDEEVPELAISPDAYVEPTKKKGKITIAAEAKCLGSGRHVEAFIKQEIPDDYVEQIKWYFALNPDLELVYMCFYDPRMIVHDFFFLEITRGMFVGEVDEIADLKTQITQKMEKIESYVVELTKGTDLEF